MSCWRRSSTLPARQAKSLSLKQPQSASKAICVLLELPKSGGKLPRSKASMIRGFLWKQANIFKVPIVLGVIHAVTHHKTIRNLKSHIVGLNWHQSPLWLIEACCDLQGSRL